MQQQMQQMQSNPTLLAYQQKLQEQSGLIKRLLEENTELKSKNEYLENKMKEIIQKSIQEKMRKKS